MQFLSTLAGFSCDFEGIWVGCGFTEITVSFALLSGGACYLHKSGLITIFVNLRLSLVSN